MEESAREGEHAFDLRYDYHNDRIIKAASLCGQLCSIRIAHEWTNVIMHVCPSVIGPTALSVTQARNHGDLFTIYPPSTVPLTVVQYSTAAYFKINRGVKTRTIYLNIGENEPISFKLSMMNEATKLYFDDSLNDVGHHSRSELRESSNIRVIILL